MKQQVQYKGDQIPTIWSKQNRKIQLFSQILIPGQTSALQGILSSYAFFDELLFYLSLSYIYLCLFALINDKIGIDFAKSIS